MEVAPGELRVFEPEEEFGTEGCSGNSGGDYGPADWSRKRIAETAAECEEDAEGDDVSKDLEEDVGVDFVWAQRNVNRELCREME